VAEEPGAGSERFSWRCGTAVVELAWAEGVWTVSLTAPCRLLGPPQVLYRGSHQDPLHAAWDLMARVNHVCHDEEQGVLAGRSAARWLREQPMVSR
jgi:hypothetical protein